MLSNLWNSIKNKVSDVWKSIKDRGSSLLTGTKYVGPFNALTPEYLKNNPPVDKVDEGALFHDLDYSRIAKARDAGKVSRDEAKKLIRESDERFLHNTLKHSSENPWASTLGFLGIKGKNLAEDYLGLDPHKFVTAKKGMLLRLNMGYDFSSKPLPMPYTPPKFGFGQERTTTRVSNM